MKYLKHDHRKAYEKSSPKIEELISEYHVTDSTSNQTKHFLFK